MQHGDYLQASWAIPKRKSQNKDMEFPGVLKSLWKFQESSKKEYNFHLIKNNHVEFPWVLLLVLEFPRVVGHFCGFFCGETLFPPEFPRTK